MKFKNILQTALLFASPAFAQAATFYNLDFSNNVQATNGADGPNGSGLGDYYTGTTLDFTNVAPGSGETINLRLTVTGITTPRYVFDGSIPNYSALPGEPSGDLGFYYRYVGDTDHGVGGITYNLDFYDGVTGDGFTTPKILSDFRLMIYDVDGEDPQSESVRVQSAQGFYGYQLPTTQDVTVADEGNGSFLFTGPGANRDEDDPTGAFVLYFHETSSISLQMEANTFSGNNNGVFSAIDGDLSLNPSLGGFDPIELSPVPEPSSFMVTFSGLGLALCTVRRRLRPAGK